jgi:hypothetical protein
MYSPPRDLAKLAAWGLTLDDFKDEDNVEVWPENWPTVRFFDAIPPGAWNVGPGGPIGIRPEALREVRLSLGITRPKWQLMYDDVQVMESEALKTMNESMRAAAPGVH